VAALGVGCRQLTAAKRAAVDHRRAAGDPVGRAALELPQRLSQLFASAWLKASSNTINGNNLGNTLRTARLPYDLQIGRKSVFKGSTASKPLR